ncbi:hypothetical protein VTN02DRAFT_4999 [Thermoascus thermophilus]
MASTSAGASLPIAVSQDGDYVARLNGKELVIHTGSASQNPRVLGIIKLKEPLGSQAKHLKLSHLSSHEPEISEDLGLVSRQHLLCATDARVTVWQLHPLKWHAEIENVESGLTYVDFGGDENEIICFHPWNTKITLFTLDTGRSQVIKSPKFSNPNGYGYRPRTRQLAVLLKPDANDVLTVHEAQTYELISRAVLPTVDAQGLKWSPDGKWIAVWEAASAGTKVLIYTADGQLFRTYTGPAGSDSAFDLGVRTIEWSPAIGHGPASEYLAVAKIDGSVDLLSSRTFSCSTSLSHTFHIDHYSPSIWRERYSNADGDLEYAEASGSSAFTTPTDSSSLPRGVSMALFSFDGSLLATVDQSRSNVVWIWSLGTAPRLQSALVHEHGVRQLSWHPNKPELLISTSNSAVAAVHLWSLDGDPVIARVPISRSDAGKYEVSWVKADDAGRSVFWFGTPEEYALGTLSVQEGSAQLNVLYLVNGTKDVHNFDIMTISQYGT